MARIETTVDLEKDLTMYVVNGHFLKLKDCHTNIESSRNWRKLKTGWGFKHGPVSLFPVFSA